jgi:hypothetical protein
MSSGEALCLLAAIIIQHHCSVPHATSFNSIPLWEATPSSMAQYHLWSNLQSIVSSRDERGVLDEETRMFLQSLSPTRLCHTLDAPCMVMSSTADGVSPPYCYIFIHGQSAQRAVPCRCCCSVSRQQYDQLLREL